MPLDDSDTASAGRTDYRRKIVPLDALLPRLEAARRAGRTIVQCHGCFDLVHPGHVRYLQFARNQGDVLVVSITGDAAIDKGDQRPYIPQELRAENLAALAFVDYVVIDPNPSACQLLVTIRPDVYVKGQEYATSNHAGFLAERAAVEANGGRVVFSSGDVVFSSSRLIDAVRPDLELEQRRLAAVCQRHALSVESTRRYLSALRRKRLLVVGDSVVDRYILCEADSIAGDAPVMSLRSLDRKNFLGAAAAVAAQVRALGAATTFVTAVAEDEPSHWLIEQLELAGVDVVSVPGRTNVAIRTRYLVDEQKLFRVDDGATCPLDSITERRAADAILDHVRGADGAILCDAGYGTMTSGLLQRLGGTFHQRCPLLVGAVSDHRGDLTILRHLSLCVASERRLRSALGDSATGLSAVVHRLLQVTQSHRAMITLGKRGTVTFDRPSQDPSSSEWSGRLRSEYVPALADRPRDRLGSLESVVAAGAAALTVGATLMQAAYLAMATAAIQVERLGTSSIEATTLERWLATRRELIRDEGEEPPPAGWAAAESTYAKH